MIVQDVINQLHDLAPLAYAEDFDNVGLLVGKSSQKVSGILVTLDTLESVVDEAIENNCNLIVSFHPIIFKGLKKLIGKTYVERVVMKAIKHDIAIFAIHTALDNAYHGVNSIICDQLNLKNKQILMPQKGSIKKLTTYVTVDSADKVRQALFDVGAGNIGNYDNCSFNSEGVGTFKGNDASNPVIGERGELSKETEIQLNITFQKHLESKILRTLFEVHPYEEVAFEVITLDNSNQHIGMGMLGELDIEMAELDFLKFVKDKMKSSVVRHSQLFDRPIKKVAVLGGSGAFAIGAAKAAGVDILVTSDLKYHDFFSAEKDIIVADIGHYESEQYTKTFLVDYLSKKITNFAPAFDLGRIILSNTNTNPVKYL